MAAGGRILPDGEALGALAKNDSVLVSCRDLAVGHGGRAILPAINVAIGKGELWAVVGRNGSGKSTWFRTVLGLQPPVSGAVDRTAALRSSYIPQREVLDDIYPLRARDVVAMGEERGLSFMKPRFGASAAVGRALAEVGAADLAGRSFRTLSQGQKQRVLLARLVVSAPDLALLDEPTAAMDHVAEREAFAVLDGLRKDLGTAVLVVSHYLEVARTFATHAILFDGDRQTVTEGSAEEVFGHDAYRESYGEIVGSLKLGEDHA